MNRRASAFDARSMMEDRSKVAAAAASVIPFSCIICFDEFDSQERPPMILPCGHTYVCLPCTKRLKRCMECRQPLFLPAPIPAAAAAAHQQHHAVTKAPHPPHLPPHGTTHYYHHHQQQQQQPYYQLTQQQRLAQRYGTPALPDVAPLTPPQWALANSHNQRIPLPIPKNLVLLSMMEAAERQARINNELSLALREEENSDDDDDDGESNDDDDDEEDEEAFDLNKIITGMATLSGPCGTYAVREKGGLVVVRADPRRRRNDSNNDNKKNDDPTTTTIILERKSSKESSESTTPEEGETDEKKEEDGDVVAATATAAAEEEQELLLLVQEGPQSPIPLEYGQTVQVVSFEDGVAKLARSKGYVLGNSSQLVKVGGALDESCRLEGLLNTVLCRGEDLQKTLDDNRQIERSLQRQLEMALASEPSHPIISHLPREHHDDHDDDDDHVDDDEDCKLPASASHDPEDAAHIQNHNHLLQTPRQAATTLLQTPERSVTDVYHTPQQRSVIDSENSPASPKSPNSIDNSDIGIGPYMPHYRECGSQDSSSGGGGGGRIVDFGCGSVLLEEGASELFGENVGSSGIIAGDRSVRSTGARGDTRRSTTSATTDDNNRLRSASIELLGRRPSPQTTGAGAASATGSSSSQHHLHPAPTLTASFDNIDFRTGLSGHRALTTAHLHSSPKPNKRHIRMMGEHRGLGR